MNDRSHTAAGDVDYGLLGAGYSAHRRPDPHLQARIHAALGPAKSVLNVGAGAGSYEPLDRQVIAVEPSAAMRELRSSHHVRAIDACAESLPLADRSVDASMAILTVHQWRDLGAGLAELRRVTRGPIVVVTFDGDENDRFWLAEYVPELGAAERRRHPPIASLVEALSTPARRATVKTLSIPIDCTDGFTEAFYARPERLLDPAVLRAQSSWNFVSAEVKERFVRTLAADLASGRWDERFGHWRTAPFFDGSLRLVVGGDSAIA